MFSVHLNACMNISNKKQNKTNKRTRVFLPFNRNYYNALSGYFRKQYNGYVYTFSFVILITRDVF